MQVKKLKQDGLNHELEITVEAKEIDQRVDSRIKEVGKTYRVQGFRPGKVPHDILKKKLGPAVMGEVLESTVNETSQKAMQDNDIRPALQPKIEVKSFDQGKDLVYTMAIEVLPKVEVQNYRGLKLEKPVAKADDKAIDEALGRIASMRKTSEPITTDRATKSGDIIVMDFNGRTADDNVAHPGMSSQAYRLELGSGQFIPGFEDQLIGKKKGAKVEVKVSFPEEYGAPELAGRDAIFDVEIHEIHTAKDPEINDEFAKSFGMEDVAALRKAVEDQSNREFDNQSRLKLKKALLDQLDDAHDFAIPAGMKDMEYKNILQQVEMDARQRGADSKLSDEEKEELEAIAERRVRLGLILSEIGRDNKIVVADAELQRAVVAEAQKYPGQEKQVFDYFAKNRQALDMLRAPLYEEKVVDFILELSEVTETTVTIEELTADEEMESVNKSKKKASSKDEGGKKEPAKKKK